MAPQLTEVEFAGHTVKVPKGGYYDRYRSNPDLDEVAHDAAVGNIDWFRRIPKVQVESRVGPIWAPNFYYRASIVQATMLAPFDRLAAMLPEPLEPLRAFPGFGVVALTFSATRSATTTPTTKLPWPSSSGSPVTRER